MCNFDLTVSQLPHYVSTAVQDNAFIYLHGAVSSPIHPLLPPHRHVCCMCVVASAARSVISAVVNEFGTGWPIRISHYDVIISSLINDLYILFIITITNSQPYFSCVAALLLRKRDKRLPSFHIFSQFRLGARARVPLYVKKFLKCAASRSDQQSHLH